MSFQPGRPEGWPLMREMVFPVTASEREGNHLKGSSRHLPEQWLRPKPESGIGCLICAELTRGRIVQLGLETHWQLRGGGRSTEKKN